MPALPTLERVFCTVPSPWQVLGKYRLAKTGIESDPLKEEPLNRATLVPSVPVGPS